MATFLLVHGGCHGGWCYSKVAAALCTVGHDVYAPTLSGLAERAGLADRAINLSTHIEDIAALIEVQDLHDIILCGHSYGGMVITGVAGRLGDRIRSLVYVDGCVPEDGQSLLDLVGPERTLAMLHAAGKTGIMMEAPSAEFFKVEPQNVALVNGLCTPHPIACFVQKLHLTGKEDLVRQRTFVLCERYHSINHQTCARVSALPGWKIASVDSGHDIMVDQPDVLAALLIEELER